MIWKPLLATAILSLCLGNVAAQDKDKSPEPIPEKEWPAWVTAGATIGFMGEFVPGLVRFDLRYRDEGGYLPAFRFDDWPPKQKLSTLPAITVPFGLDFHDKKVTDGDLKELAGLKSLRSLRLNGTQVTNAGLKELVGLSDLQVLDLGSTPVSDAGLKELAGFKNLRLLLLDGTKVTDDGLKELTALKSLQTVNLNKTGATEEGVRQLKKALPDCRVVQNK
jgi:internalin A